MESRARGRESADSDGRRSLEVLLLALVTLRLALHVFLIPVFEGPDEPFHLGRVLQTAQAGDVGELPVPVVQAIRAHPCGPPLARAFGCLPFGAKSSLFNILKPVQEATNGSRTDNYESHQPPLYYFLLGCVFRVAPARSVEGSLLILRMASFSCVLLALLGPLRALSERPLRITGLCLLLLPGASEALIRGSNDGLLFLWAALVLLALKKSTQPWWLLALMAAGPLIKLSAFPIVAYAIGRLWMRGRRAEAVMAGSISMLVLPVQFLRGWKWGGTYELNRVAGGALPPPMTVLKGGARSVYSFGKTIGWLGGWNSFREPKLLVVAWFILAALWLLAIRPAGSKSEAMAFVLGLVVALAGFGVLAVGNWRLFHDWGGLGGWYAWGWAPWLALGLPLSIRTRREVTRLIAVASLVFLVAVNVAWFRLAVRQYGPRTQAPHTRGVLTSDSPAAS